MKTQETQSIRESLEALEEQSLSHFAAPSSRSRGRAQAEAPCPLRTTYQRDRDRILHSKAFRRLNHKTQVFISPQGDHYRTRMTHSLEVAQVSRTIARALRLNEDLTECIALGHDLGHPPFGHTGENVLNELFAEGFHHQQQSLRIVQVLEPLNLSAEVLDGIEGGPDFLTLEARIVDTADRMAYLHHDVEDARRAGLMNEADLPREVTAVLGSSRQERLDRMVLDMVAQSALALADGYPQIRMSAEVSEAMFALRQWMFNHVYLTDARREQGKKVHLMLSALYDYFLTHPDQISANIPEDASPERRIVDYIAGMTDRFAIEAYKHLLLPRPFQNEQEWVFLP